MRERWGCRVVLAAALVAAAAGPARADAYKDEKLGFSLTTPKKWKQMPVAADETWVVAKFQSEREYDGSDPKGNSWIRHTPYLDVVVIPLSLAERKGATVEKEADGTLKVKSAAPWKNLKEYLDKTLQASYESGGFYFSKEEETELNGLRVIQYEITMDKILSSMQAPKRIYGWAFHTEDAIFGVVSETLIQHEEKLKPDILGAFRTFRTFARTGALPNAEHTGEDVVVKDPAKEANVSEGEKERRRRDAVNRRIHKIQETLAPGWTVKESPNFIAVSHADAKFTKQTLDHAEALREWLETELGFVGNGYTGRVILRICADREEHEAYCKTAGWSADQVEVTTFKDKEGYGPGEWSVRSLNQGIYDIWLRDKNDTLRWRLPQWLSSGLTEVIASASSKGRKLEFAPSTWDKAQIGELRRADKLLTAYRFFSMTSGELWGDFQNHNQAQFFTSFLLVGGARKNPKTKNVLTDYLKNFVFLLDEMDDGSAKKDAGPAEPKTEQEEDEMFRRRQEEWRNAEKDVLRRLLDKTFAGWTDKDWDRFNASYWKELE